MAQKDTTKDGNGGNLGFEAELFKTADKLRGNMEPSDYKTTTASLKLLVLRCALDGKPTVCSA